MPVHIQLLSWIPADMQLLKLSHSIPAYMQLVNLSHSFNVMDSRGAVGVTLRATCLGAMRTLAKQIAGEVQHHPRCNQIGCAYSALELEF